MNNGVSPSPTPTPLMVANSMHVSVFQEILLCPTVVFVLWLWQIVVLVTSTRDVIHYQVACIGPHHHQKPGRWKNKKGNWRGCRKKRATRCLVALLSRCGLKEAERKPRVFFIWSHFLVEIDVMAPVLHGDGQVHANVLCCSTHCVFVSLGITSPPCFIFSALLLPGAGGFFCCCLVWDYSYLSLCVCLFL